MFNHHKNLLFLSLARLFERASFYGIRSILVIYLANSSLNLSYLQAGEFYALLLALLVFSDFIGALIGDFLLGNKKSLFIGIILSILGVILIEIETKLTVFSGLFTLALGSGLFSSNCIGLLGMSYSYQKDLSYSGFIFYFLATDLGAFLLTVTGFMYSEYYFGLVMLVPLISYLLSLIFIFLSKEKILIETGGLKASKQTYFKLTLYLFYSLIILAICPILLDIKGLSNNFYHLMDDNTLKFATQIYEFIISVIAGVILFIYFSFKQKNEIKKIGIVLLITAFLFILIYSSLKEYARLIIYVAIGFVIIMETLVRPLIFTLILKHLNNKNITTKMAFANLIMKFISSLVIIPLVVEIESSSIFFVSIILLIILGIVFLINKNFDSEEKLFSNQTPPKIQDNS